MKNKLKAIAAFAVAAVSALSLTACGKKGITLDYKDCFALKYDTGLDEYGNFDSDKYSYNALDAIGADPGAIYVSEEDDSVYGGYFYIYITGATTSGFTAGTGILPEDTAGLAFQCMRSKDLSVWEICGAANGYSLIGLESDWEEWGNTWAPEVIYNANDTEYPYYMYYTTPSEVRASGRLVSSVNNTYNMRMHIGIAKSKTPVGPFYTCSDTETINGVEQKIPYIDFKYAYGLDFDTGVIDVSPFLDDNGDLYLYFKTESFENKGARAAIYGMKMLDWFTPDYDSVKLLAAGGYTEVKSDKRGKEAFLNEYTSEEIAAWTVYDGGSDLLEAPFMYKHNGKYYLTYAFHGYQNPSYSVLQSIGDSPLGDFVAPQTSAGNPVLDGTQTMYMKGTAHHALVAVGEDLYVIYHRHATTESIGASRYIAADKVTFTEVNGQTVMTANGPSIGLNFIGEEITGYKNLAKNAKVTATGGSGTEYLTDGLLPMYSYVDDKVFSTEEDVTLTFEFAQPVNVEAIMIHNSRSSDTAFSKIADVRFELAEQPSFLTGGQTYKYAAIKDLAFPAEYWKETDEKYIACCAPAVADFDSIKVKSVSVTIKASDKLVLEDKYGEGKKVINISEIIILGR